MVIEYPVIPLSGSSMSDHSHTKTVGVREGEVEGRGRGGGNPWRTQINWRKEYSSIC